MKYSQSKSISTPFRPSMPRLSMNFIKIIIFSIATQSLVLASSLRYEVELDVIPSQGENEVNLNFDVTMTSPRLGTDDLDSLSDDSRLHNRHHHHHRHEEDELLQNSTENNPTKISSNTNYGK